MNWNPAQKIADAVLYEGYLLYPYRASSLKNRSRLMFGTLQPGDSFHLEVLFSGPLESRLAVKLRFLRETAQAVEEREVLLGETPLGNLLREHPAVDNLLHCDAEAAGEGLFRIRLQVENRGADALLSCHVLLSEEGGEFLSATDPRAAECESRGLWPVLVSPSLVLGAPMILPDYPTVAPESPGDLFDLTEIDEILSLRIMTLTEEEKEQMRRGDERARRLLLKTESLSGPELLALHGSARTLPRPGDRVRLRPRGRADIMDLALDGKEATVVSVEEDLEGGRYLAVTVKDDPGSDLGELGFLGHRFFFRPEEVERL